MGEWQFGLCGCFGNLGTCIMAYFLPCWVAGKNAEKAGRGSCLMCGLATLLGPVGWYCVAKTRESVRESKGIDGGFCNDCIVSMFCPFCVIVQTARELDGPSSIGQSMARQ
uniref:Uncharacterized protein n=1 Tax=Ciona savignyi TaxID=51511 RepID=H2ZN89_CIOSA